MGPALCLISAAAFGAMPIFGRFAYEAGVSPGALLLVRFCLAAAILAMLLLARPGMRRIEPGTSRTRVILIALGLGAVGYAAQAGLYFSALQRIDASPLSLILYTYPVLVTVMAVLLRRDRLTLWRGAALVAGSGGIVLVLAGAGSLRLQPFGALLAFGAAIVYTTYILVSDTVVHRLPPVLLSALVMTGAAASLGVAAIITRVGFGFGWRGWFWLACIAVVSTVLAMLTFFAGLRRTGPSTTAILSTFEPVVTTALATATLGETLTPLQACGGLLVLGSVVLLQLRQVRPHAGRAPRRTPAEAGSPGG